MIVFSDEARFSFRPDHKKWWVQDDDMSVKATTQIRKYPYSTLIWAAIGHNFKSKIIFIDKSVNQERYKEILKQSKIFQDLDQMRKPFNYYFQQDGATYHQTDNVLNFIFKKARVLNGWPLNSPDLSPIENLWAIMKERLNRLTTNQKIKMN